MGTCFESGRKIAPQSAAFPTEPARWQALPFAATGLTRCLHQAVVRGAPTRAAPHRPGSARLPGLPSPAGHTSVSQGHPSTRATPQTQLSQGCPAPCSFPACHGGVRGIKGQELSRRHTGLLLRDRRGAAINARKTCCALKLFA